MDQNQARHIAADWHSGQSSPLYAFASTGAIVHGIEREIQDCIDGPHDDPGSRVELEALMGYVDSATDLRIAQGYRPYNHARTGKVERQTDEDDEEEG